MQSFRAETPSVAFSWTVVRASEHEAIARGEGPSGFLSAVERETLADVAFPVRRKKWLLGRWAAKRLLVEALAERDGMPPDPTDLTIGNEPSGAPFVELAGEGRVPWRLSLSHREDLALAALTTEPCEGLGADLEMIVERDEGLVRDFFTEDEAAEVSRASGRDALVLVARTWSAKEAVSKALGVGLRIDTRRLLVRGLHRDPEVEAQGRGWMALDVTVRTGRGGEGVRRPEVLWRDDGEYVLSVAVLTR